MQFRKNGALAQKTFSIWFRFEPRPVGYARSVGDEKISIPSGIGRLGQSGKDCFDAIVKRDAAALGASMTLTMKCWETLLPECGMASNGLEPDLMPLLTAYQKQYHGAMLSGCGGGYLTVVSDKPVPGAIKVTIRVSKQS